MNEGEHNQAFAKRERDGFAVKTFQHQLTKGGGIPEGGTPGKGGA